MRSEQGGSLRELREQLDKIYKEELSKSKYMKETVEEMSVLDEILKQSSFYPKSEERYTILASEINAYLG